MHTQEHAEHVDTLVIGGGQAGLSVGYHLKRKGIPFLIVDASERIGDAWRNRWDSLRLFTPAKLNGLDGLAFPAHPDDFPTKNEMADYLESYAEHFELPVRSGVRVSGLTRPGGHDARREHGGEERHAARFVATTTRGRITADNVVVAMAGYQRPKKPSFAAELSPSIRQLHSAEYRSPDQLEPGPVLLVGAGNSGSEIAMELSKDHRVWMSGRDVGQIPFRPRSLFGQRLAVRLVLRGLFHRVLTVDTPVGRKARPKILGMGGPLIRVKYRDLRRAGVERLPKTAGIDNGFPVLEDGRVLQPANVVWCTGFEPGFEWIDLPGQPGGGATHESGIATDDPGLYYVGLHFLHALSSGMIHGVGRDARRIADAIAERKETSDDERALYTAA